MKKAFVLLSLLSIVLPLSAAWYSSNELGQKKGELEAFSSVGWVLYEDDERSVLYSDGNEIKRKEYTFSGWTEKSGDETETVFLSPDGRIERRVIENGEDRKEYNYFYSLSILSGYNYSLNGTLIENVEYTTTEKGDLLYYRVLDEGVYLSDNYFVYDGGDRIEIGAFEINESEGEREPTESGGYIEKKDDTEYEYDSLGRLIREEKEDTRITYTYLDDGTLSEKREEDKDGVYVTEYTLDGDILSYYNTSGEKVTQRRTLSDGTIEETRYINNKPTYVFIYDRDGRRIKEAYSL